MVGPVLSGLLSSSEIIVEVPLTSSIVDDKRAWRGVEIPGVETPIVVGFVISSLRPIFSLIGVTAEFNTEYAAKKLDIAMKIKRN